MSLAGPTGSPVTRSGAMYRGVPTWELVFDAVASTMRAMPKSPSLTVSGSATPTKTFSGLTSPWTTDAAWAASRASAS
jgi:hypothetical protein